MGCGILESNALPVQGFTDFMAAIMVACFGAGCCLGSFLGGAIGMTHNSGKGFACTCSFACHPVTSCAQATGLLACVLSLTPL